MKNKKVYHISDQCVSLCNKLFKDIIYFFFPSLFIYT